MREIGFMGDWTDWIACGPSAERRCKPWLCSWIAPWTSCLLVSHDSLPTVAMLSATFIALNFYFPSSNITIRVHEAWRESICEGTGLSKRRRTLLCRDAFLEPHHRQ